jgi:hypothetical protein
MLSLVLLVFGIAAAAAAAADPEIMEEDHVLGRLSQILL